MLMFSSTKVISCSKYKWINGIRKNNALKFLKNGRAITAAAAEKIISSNAYRPFPSEL